MKLIKREWLQLLILIVPILIAAAVWDRLPPKMATHWDASGRVNGYGSPLFAVGLPTCLNIGLTLLIGFLPLIDPRTRHYGEEGRANLARIARTFRLAITAFIAVVTLAIIGFALGYKINISILMPICIGFLFVILGNGMSKLRPNSFMGIRTKWTLESPEVWAKTHRLAGRLMVAGGILLIVLTFLLPAGKAILFAIFPITIVATILPAAYSYIYFKQLSVT